MSADVALPEGFAELQRFAADWALDSEAARNAKRLASSFEEIRAFYDAMLPTMDAVGEHLGRFALGDLPDAERRLFHLAQIGRASCRERV